MRAHKFSFILFCLIVLPYTASAVEIVRMNVQIGAGQQYDLDLELYDATPITRDNFLSYVGSNRYDNSFIHRSVTDFVIQGGGFTFDPAVGTFENDPVTNTYPGGLQKILSDGTILNEFIGSGLSNVRGTIAMARTSDPNSATSQWFINQVDNTFLDGGSGYAVFGRVLDDGMNVVDQIGALSIFNLSSVHSAFGELPLTNYVSGAPIIQDNLVRINSATVIQRPIIQSDIDPIDFPLIPVGGSSQQIITLSNTGNADLVMDGTSLATLLAPFNILAETCLNNTLSPVSVNPADTCSVTIQFSPTVAGNYQDNLVITPSENPFSVSASFKISGEGMPNTPLLSVVNNITVLDFIDVASNTTSAAEIITLQNRGGTPLNLSAVSVSGTDAGQFLIDTGCSNTTTLLTGETCNLAVNFAPLSEGAKSALLTINSDGGTKLIDLAGTALGPEIELNKSSLDFGFVQINETVTDGFNVKNLGVAALEINSIVITGADAADFVQVNSCQQPLTTQYSSCAIAVYFTPTSAGVKNATLTMTTNDLDEGVININITGATGIADIDAVQQVDVGVAQTSLTPSYNQITITNLGLAFLDFSTINIAGVDSSSFLVGHNCPGTPTTSGSLSPLGLNETCTIEVQFLPVTSGVHSASLEISSNDIDEPVFIINLTGLGELDVDGITDLVEQNAPNNGDANNDAVQDNIQNNVASFLTDMGVYASIVSAPNTLLTNVSIPPNPSPDNMPNTANFKHGMFQYTIGTSSPVVQVAVYMPADDNSSMYYKYGPTPDNPNPHWYDFSYDGTTGAQYIGKVDVQPEGQPDAPIVKRSMFILSYIDGQRGDDDLTVNGEIVTVGALSSVATSSDGGGSISWYFILLSTLMLHLSRLRRPNKKTLCVIIK